MKYRKLWYLIAGVCCAAMICGVFFYCWDSRHPKFQDLTVELGTPSLTAAAFQTEYAWAGNCGFVSDISQVDLGCVGESEIQLRHGLSEERVSLTVLDTTPPSATVDAAREIPVTGFPEAAELVRDISDASEVKVFYKEEPRIPLDYSDVTATVVIEDEYGNRTEKDCVFSFRWMRQSVTVELGTEITPDLVLYRPERDASFLDAAMLNRIRVGGIGEYTVTGVHDGRAQDCILTVQDTTGPQLVLRDLQSRYGSRLKWEDFVVEATDASGIAELRCLSDITKKLPGKYPVVVEAEDTAGNVTRQEATLYVATEFNPPRIRGDLPTLTLAKNEELPNMLEGISAVDIADGEVPVVCDLSGVDRMAGGTYYAVYRATDSSGNTATRKRKIVIVHDEEDTRRIVNEIAATFADDDVEGIRNSVFYGIGYNGEWGGDDPVWYGFTEKRGNCYVHACCMKALLDAKGIENQLIWTTNETHYWLIVKVNNTWKHVDPTPSLVRGPVLMNDEERLATLSNRQWDTTRWPSCP